MPVFFFLKIIFDVKTVATSCAREYAAHKDGDGKGAPSGKTTENRGRSFNAPFAVTMGGAKRGARDFE